jgi:hypothetical protein
LKTLSRSLGRLDTSSEGWLNELEIMAFGINGAALAALGEMPAGFFPAAPALRVFPLGERKDGVKLGESTFRVFLD